MSDFEADWRRRHSEAPPVAYMLRAVGARHWLRMHCLPESKRYADTAAEHAIIRGRQNALASEALGEGVECWLVRCRHRYDNDLPAPDELPPAFSIHDPDEDLVIDVHAEAVAWVSGAFDKLLEDVAEDRVRDILWMSRTTGSIFAPYDGGVDLFLDRPAAVWRLVAKHPDWMSSHPEGL